MTRKTLFHIFLLSFFLYSCNNEKEVNTINTQGLPENVKKRMRDSIDLILFDSLEAGIRTKRKIDELPYYKAMYEIDTTNIKYLTKYAGALAGVGRIEPSIKLLNNALKWTDKPAKIYNCKGDVWQMITTINQKNGVDYKKDLDSVLFYYKKACDTDTNDVELFVSLCITYQYLEKYEEAIKAIENAIRIQPENQDHILFRGSCKVGLDDYKGAYDDLKIITPFRRHDASMYYNRAIAESYLKMPNESVMDFDTCEMLNLRTPQLYYFRGIMKTNIDSKRISGFQDIIKAYEMGYPVPKKEYEQVKEKLKEKTI